MAISICEVHTTQNHKDTTIHGNMDFPIACYEDDMQLINVPIHWHDEYEYIIAIKGTVTVIVNGINIKLNVGDSIFINSGCLHEVKRVTDADSVLRSLVILPKLVGGSSDSIIYKRIILPFTAKDAPAFVILNQQNNWQKEISDCMLMAWSSISSESFDYENETRYQIAKAMRILVEHMPELNLFHDSNTVLLNRMKQAISYIEEHYSDDISNSVLMELLNCSESHLLRSFKQVLGITPMKYLMNIRIQKAAEMLLTTDLKSSEISISCGFHDFSYFTKVFRQNMGTTPSKYRDSV